MKKSKALFISFVLIISLYCLRTFATETMESSSNASAIFLRYRGVFDGPALLNPSQFRPDAFGEASTTEPIQVRNTIALGRFQTDSPELSEISANLTWSLKPLSDHTADLDDPFVRYAQTKAFTLKQGFLGFDLRAVLPLNSESRASRLRIGIESHPTFFYAFNQSAWSLESSAGLRINLFGSPSPESEQRTLPTWELHLSPGVAHPLTSHWDFTSTFHFGLVQNRGSHPENQGTLFEPGFRWQTSGTSHLNTYWRVHPYLLVPLLPSISFQNWTFGTEVSAVLF